MQRRIFLSAIMGLALAGTARAHEVMTLAEAGPIGEEVLAFRASFATVIAARNAARLRDMFTPSYTHTHGSGRVDGRDARVGQLLAGDPVVETAPTSDMSVRVLSRDTVILSAVSPILNTTEGRSYDFRWMQVYVRLDGQWHLAASQATRLPVAA
ncbi:nuclear transport factor 2 family protein [Plastoroseomonas arctica]|uniref:Nuclear transport factor 2 family protein n=1 Tax=Plastoroseomonas arctica TaxID=1509237 RepID=A0AAF1KV01_9PROT|nr:nuclear transport factor 2 family protein [Plastoroseomonas arctica]MBR0657552.1 nuclear transport factor 2 family protein [Plastoroseomonas arctica]